MTVSDLMRVESAPAAPSPARRRSATVCVGIATRGRPDQAKQIVGLLSKQSLRPAAIVVVCVEPADIHGLQSAPDLEIVFAPAGLTKQRNAVLDRVPAASDYVVYFDDDFLPDDRWLEVVVSQFEADPSVVCITGNVVADGILGPGLTYEDAQAALARADRRRLDWRIEGYSPYGCNMAFRASALVNLRFDERLVLYGWLEDRDLGARVATGGGRLVKLGAALGVHLGVKRGRVSGRRLGYSQIVNPFYLRAKGSMSWRSAVKQVLRNIGANLAKSPRPEPFIDRRGRLWGNALGLVDLLAGVCAPERAELL